MKLAFLGGGNMASALIGGLLAKGYAVRDISVVELSPAARDRLAERYKVHVTTAPDARVQGADTLVLAVKPQQMKAALASVAGFSRQKLIVSVAAGVRIDALSRWLGGHDKIVRCMPNTPALIGAGIAGLYAAPGVSAEEKKRAEDILRAVGEVVWLADEKLIDPVTAVSGSGPAYVFWFIEQMAAAAVMLGIPETDALVLAKQMVLGSARLAAESDLPPDQLRKNVTSKGGTTEAALRVFEAENMAEILRRAVQAASDRGAEMGSELGKD
jgi:pyrroline-5-carboxylate reductase